MIGHIYIEWVSTVNNIPNNTWLRNSFQKATHLYIEFLSLFVIDGSNPRKIERRAGEYIDTENQRWH